ncbi:hypothetical protein Nhal_1686 [Nitrosococcus halophilus Nc 4]|uniref:Uncharacterized protein n=1 Tax=Nitrosococcus halophilus (strain Nc4) TaxID=472759 RepID=D5C2F5_NITHN|nr:hypothetical protein Nhal_1686 [Nitrosococcus halophilus Nc 4]
MPYRIAQFPFILLAIYMALVPAGVSSAICANETPQGGANSPFIDGIQQATLVSEKSFCPNKMPLGKGSCKESVRCLSHHFQCNHPLWSLPQGFMVSSKRVITPWALPPGVLFSQFQPFPPFRPPIFA